MPTDKAAPAAAQQAKEVRPPAQEGCPDDILNWDEFRRHFEPDSILQVIDKEALRDMLRGLLHQLSSGITIVYGVRESPGKARVVREENRVDPFNYDNPRDIEYFNRVCWKLRTSGAQNRCWECDRAAAEDYITGRRVEAASYACWLGLWEAACPIRLGDETVAVVYSGQVIPDDPGAHAAIRSKIRETAPAIADQVIAELNSEIQHRTVGGVAELQSRKARLVAFGAVLQKVVADLHEAKRHSATDALLRRCEDHLALADLADEDAWWEVLGNLVGHFSRQIGLDRAQFYVRSGSSFEHRGPLFGNSYKADRIAAREVLESLPAGTICSGADSEDARQFAARLAAPSDRDQLWFYRTATRAGAAQAAILFVLEGDLSGKYRQLAEKLLHAVGRRAEFASLVFELRGTHQRYLQMVADATHDYRTPLQALYFDIDSILKSEAVRRDAAMVERLQKSNRRIFLAKIQAESLLAQTMSPWDELDLVETVYGVMESLEPRAIKHPCKLVRWGKWPEGVFVRADRSKLFRVFANFLDNAIKFSFHGDMYQVRVSFDTAEPGFVTVRISSFGVGIPKQKLQEIRLRGQRAAVSDRKDVRPGTGLGLAIADTFLGEMNGTFQIESVPHGEPSQHGATAYLRYVTTVDVRLKAISH